MNSLDSVADKFQSAQILSDRLLVERCVSRDPLAWDELYQTYQQSIIVKIQRVFHPIDANIVEEISARVWYRLLQNDCALLDRFDHNQNCRLGTFLSIIAKSEAYNYFRSERRRTNREREVSKDESTSDLPEGYCTQELDEFFRLLTDREKEFFNDHVGFRDEDVPSLDISQQNQWQLKSRVLRKFRAFFLPPA